MLQTMKQFVFLSVTKGRQPEGLNLPAGRIARILSV